MRRFLGTSLLAAVVVTLGFVGVVAATPQASASDRLDRVLNLPLVNRDASNGPGGVNPALPTDPTVLRSLLDEARSRSIAPSSYRALLFQYWLADTTKAAGIDLASWNPRAGVSANRQNLVRSYRFYENLQLSHRELQWAGMGLSLIHI